MISGVSVAYIKFSKQKTGGRLAALIVWLTTFLGILLYGLYPGSLTLNLSVNKHSGHASRLYSIFNRDATTVFVT